MLVFSANQALGQRLAVSTNMTDYVRTQTLNAEASYGVGRHWSVNADVKYNPYGNISRQRAFAVGTRWWPWHIYSGWWVSGKMKYQEYCSKAGDLLEGDRYGGGFSGGYSYMIGKHFNIDLGFGVWGGYEQFSQYVCETCGRLAARGSRYFLTPDDFIIALTFVF